jgi:hypothetical protein
MPWIILRTKKSIREKGRKVRYYPGDSVDVGKAIAKQWIENGEAEDVYGQVKIDLGTKAANPDYGIVVWGVTEGEFNSPIGQQFNLTFGQPQIPYKYTFIWNPRQPVSERLLNYGWLRVEEDNPKPERWEMAARLVSLKATAEDYGTDYEQEKTKRLIGDLRLPVYESRLIWARDCEASQRVVKEFAAQLEDGGGPNHSFLRALYSKRAMLCTLPNEWAKR